MLTFEQRLQELNSYIKSCRNYMSYDLNVCICGYTFGNAARNELDAYILSNYGSDIDKIVTELAIKCGLSQDRQAINTRCAELLYSVYNRILKGVFDDNERVVLHIDEELLRYRISATIRSIYKCYRG